MARGIWSGAISFGLINIPVTVLTAKEQDRIGFKMLDKRNTAPIGYKQYNKATGREVTRKNIVKGYEYEKGEFVIITEDDLLKANPKAAQTIDIEDFVNLKDLDILFFEKPYYLVPGKNGEKGYVLLRKTLEETKKVAISKVVFHNRQHLVALIPQGDYLILEMLRFAHEIQELSEAEYLDDVNLAKARISAKELKMARELVSSMTSKWKPDKYKDTYQDDLMKMIRHKIKTGKTETAAEVDIEPTKTNVVDLMPLLQKSLAASGRGKTKKTKRTHA